MNSNLFHYESSDFIRDYDLRLFNPDRSRISYGNDKTGFPSWSLLAGGKNADYNGYMPKLIKAAGLVCPGTCPHDCTGCYAKKMTRLPDVYIKTYLNTLEANANPGLFLALVFDELIDQAMNSQYIRVHDQGDFISQDYFDLVMSYIRRAKWWHFGIYTKCNDYVENYGLDRIPDNAVISCSPWPGISEPLGDLPQFCYDDGTVPEFRGLPHCPAVNKDGKRTGITCSQCLHCYTAKKGDRWAVFGH